MEMKILVEDVLDTEPKKDQVKLITDSQLALCQKNEGEKMPNCDNYELSSIENKKEDNKKEEEPKQNIPRKIKAQRKKNNVKVKIYVVIAIIYFIAWMYVLYRVLTGDFIEIYDGINVRKHLTVCFVIVGGLGLLFGFGKLTLCDDM